MILVLAIGFLSMKTYFQVRVDDANQKFDRKQDCDILFVS